MNKSEFTQLSEEDIEKHRLACLAVRDPELCGRDKIYGILPLAGLEARFRCTFKPEATAFNKGEVIFLW